MARSRTIRRALPQIVILLAFALVGLPGMLPAPTAWAATNTLTLRVTSARTETRAFDGAGVTVGDAVTSYQFMINLDNVGSPLQPRASGCSPSNAQYPTNCDWPSIQAQNGYAPIMTQGDATILNGTTGINLPPGNYLISVLADGYKLGGQWFSIPLEDPGLVDVVLQPLPLPTATIRVKVFEDNAITNGAPDVPIEPGLAGFRAVVNDVLGEVTVDVFGNPLCTQYELDVDGFPNPDAPIAGTGGACLSDANGDLVVPNLGPNRYGVAVVPPDGSNWVQTTTLEGLKEWDTWVQEGSTGFDTEFAIAGEPFPWTIAGFVRPTSAIPAGGSGIIRGSIASAEVYVPFQGGLPYNGGIWGGLSGAKIREPIERPYISLADLQQNDRAIWVGRGNADGSFEIRNLPDGNYTLTYWDAPLAHILDLVQVTVRNGQTVDTGVLFLTGWFARVTGTVCNDLNSNGKCDSGEPGLAGLAITNKRRTNSVMDRGAKVVTTATNGSYVLENVYPLTQWTVLELYSDLFYTVGVTYQASNQPSETTLLGAGVDVNILPVIGQGGRLDWALRPYDATGRNGGLRNGGIAGTVSYDTTRNEDDPRYAAIENWQVGIPGLTLNLYATVRDPLTGDLLYAADGSVQRGALLDTTTTEAWERPVDCLARDVDGNPVDQQVLPPATGGYECLEGPVMGLQFGNDFAAVDGNFGFGDLPANDYLVEVVIPNDAYGRPIYQVTREEDINVFDGDSYIPAIPPPACAGALHTVDVAGIAPDGPNAVVNPGWADAGGSRYEGQQKPLCNVKLVTVSNGRSIAPGFNLFTRVPVPGRYSGYIIDDLNLSTNPQDLFFGEKKGVANSPIGIYDYSNRHIRTIVSDQNGVFDVLLPSTNTINCPSPSGVCPTVYRLVGNDPGRPGDLNPNYDPQYRTISAQFEVYPGDITPADLAPTQIGVTIQAPGSQFQSAVSCALDVTTPQLFAVSTPVISASASAANRRIMITGQGFGATRGTGDVLLDGGPLDIRSWNDRQIEVQITGTTAVGVHQLLVRAANGQQTVNGITVHVLGTAYNPTVIEVDPLNQSTVSRPNFARIQDAIDYAATNNIAQPLIIIFPGGSDDPTNPGYNPLGAYYENLVIARPLKLQGVGPGGIYPNGVVVAGAVIDGGAFGGDTPIADAWRARVETLQQAGWDGNQNIYEGEVIMLVGRAGQYGAGFPMTIDGFTIQGGDQAGFPNNINQIGGAQIPGVNPIVQTQGGGIYANAYIRALRVTNNIMRSNGGAYGGAIRLGTPNLDAPNTDSFNEDARIANNRIIANGGTNLAGAIGIFGGADNYEIAENDLCGNFSAEYGGAISHYGYSPGGRIHDNRIYFNRSYDEGGAVMIAGELPASPVVLSRGAGAVDIFNNLIQGNLANDDGGGIRLLMAGNYPFTIYNNMIVNNISTHEGGGVALDDAPNVRFFNNTVMKNITTATAATSNGDPAPAGLSTGRNSTLLQATLPGGASVFSNPRLFNNIFFDNRAGSWDPGYLDPLTGLWVNRGGVAGIGLATDPNPIRYWDIGVVDGSGALAPTNSLLQTLNPSPPWAGPQLPNIASPTNLIGVSPQVTTLYDMSVSVMPWRTNPGLIGAAIVAVEAPANLLGNYHLQSVSPAIDVGASGVPGLPAPAFDIDRDPRPSRAGFDMGADEVAEPFPSTPLIDTFNQTGAAVGANWRGSRTTGFFTVQGNQLQVRNSGFIYWFPTFAADQEAYFTFVRPSTIAPLQALTLKSNVTGSTVGSTARMIGVSYNATNGTVFVETLAPGRGWFTHRTFTGITFSAGDTFGARARPDGTVLVYRNSRLIGSVNVTVGPNAWPTSYATGGGRIGMWFTAPNFTAPNNVLIDDFGGGTVQ